MNRLPSIVLAIGAGLCLAAADEVRPLTAEEMKVFLARRPEKDVIRWKDEKRGVLQVRVIEVRADEVHLQKTVNQETLDRRIPMRELAAVSFHLTKTEEDLISKPRPEAAPALRVLWDARRVLLPSADGEVGKIGLALAQSLRMADPQNAFDEVSAILDAIRAGDHSDGRKEQARVELQNLELARALGKGSPEEIDRLAWVLTEGENNPEGMMMATSWLADRHFAMLRELEEDHPRWEEDDEVMPVRQRLYHLSLDFALYPSLFHPLREREASEGLRKAWQVHQFTGDSRRALHVLEDLAALYPQSEAAAATAAEREKLARKIKSGEVIEPKTDSEEAKEEATESHAELPATPPKPKRYNLFED